MVSFDLLVVCVVLANIAALLALGVSVTNLRKALRDKRAAEGL